MVDKYNICCKISVVIIESSLKRLLLIFSGFLPQTLKGEAAENQPPFRDGAKLIFSGCEKCVFLDWTHYLI